MAWLKCSHLVFCRWRHLSLHTLLPIWLLSQSQQWHLQKDLHVQKQNHQQLISQRILRKRSHVYMHAGYTSFILQLLSIIMHTTEQDTPFYMIIVSNGANFILLAFCNLVQSRNSDLLKNIRVTDLADPGVAWGLSYVWTVWHLSWSKLMWLAGVDLSWCWSQVKTPWCWSQLKTPGQGLSEEAFLRAVMESSEPPGGAQVRR